MEFTIRGRTDKHHVTTNKVTDSLGIQILALHIDITRVPLNGGVPLTVRLDVDSTIGYDKCMEQIHNIVRLDNEIYSMLASHTNGEED